MARSLDALTGMHPEKLEQMYRAGSPADASDFSVGARTRLLAVAASSSTFLLTRRLVQIYADLPRFAVDKRFAPDGRAGHDVILGSIRYRFRVEIASSAIDDAPTLLLSYAHSADRNPWPVPSMYDELRSIEPGIAIGPTLIRGRKRPIFWFGMSTSAVSEMSGPSVL